MRLLVTLSLALILGSTAAQARPHHHRHHHHQRVVAAEAPGFWARLTSASRIVGNAATHGVKTAAISVGEGGSGLVFSARAHLGATAGQLGLPRSLWCADFTNMTLKRAGYKGTGSRMAKSFLALPKTTVHVGAIAVMGRRGGGHVGIVTGIDGSGNPIIISGNSNGRRVYEGPVSPHRVIAYVNPR